MASKSSRAVHGASIALMATVASLLGGCPTTVRCGDAETFDGTRCVPFDGDSGMSDVPMDGAVGDVPCGGTCTSPEVCDTVSGDCVDCVEDEDCDVGSRGAACVDNACVACDDNMDCTTVGASACGDDNTCGGCGDDMDCMHLAATPACDVPTTTCVECNSNADCTTANEGCDLSTHTCEGYTPGDAALCEPCLADAHCMTGQVCAPTEFPVGSGTEVGNFCLWRLLAAAPGPDDDCLTVPPYRRIDGVTTVDGEEVDVCSPQVSTCAALGDFDGPACTERGEADDACGIDGLDDGFCPATGGAVCTVGCTSFRDCPCTIEGDCSRQYDCTAGRCNSARSCDATSGTCG